MRRGRKGKCMKHISSRPIAILLVLLLLSVIGLSLLSCDGDGDELQTPTDTASESVSDTEGVSETEADSETEAVSDSESASDSGSQTESDESITEETTAAETEFTLPDPSLTPAAEMPRVDIVTAGGVDITDRENYIRASISLSNCDEEFVFTGSPANIRVRGNSTAGQVKKPYRIKFDSKQSFLGLNGGEKFKSWCLMADYFDPSFMRNRVSFGMAAALMDDLYFSSDSTHVEVYLNGNYRGVYLLCEQTQINKGRVNIYEKADGETSVEVGYLMVGQGGRTDEPDTVMIYPNINVTDRNGITAYLGQVNVSLSGGDFTEAQKNYVSKYVAGVYKVINYAINEKYYTLDRDGILWPKLEFEGTTTVEKQRETIAAVFDLDAAVRMCILDELVKNLDASTFNMYVDLSPAGDGRLTLAAPWDFDFALGNCRHTALTDPTGYYATNLTDSGGAGLRVNFLYAMLMRFDWFEDAVCEVWQAHYNGIRLAVNDVMVNAYRYADAFNRDYGCWGLPSTHFNGDHHDKTQLDSFKTHMDAATCLHDWLVKRVAWLNDQWGVDEA